MAEPITADSICDDAFVDRGLYRWKQRLMGGNGAWQPWTGALGPPVPIEEQHSDFRIYRIEVIGSDRKHFFLRNPADGKVMYEVKLVP